MQQETIVKQRERWMSVGHTFESDAAKTGSEAARITLEGTSEQETTKLALVLCSHSYEMQTLLDTISETLPGIPMIGCSTNKEIASDNPGQRSALVTLFNEDGFSVAIHSARDITDNKREKGAEATQCLDEMTPNRYATLLVMTDDLSEDQEEVVRSAYAVAGANIPLVNGCSNDDLRMQDTYQFFNDEVLTDSIVCATITSSSPIGVKVRHG